MKNDISTTGWRRLSPALLALGIMLGAFVAAAPAQIPPQTENRFLFVINTSVSMRRMTNGIQDAVRTLLQSSMQGQMRDGDTFGVWAYDDQLHTDFSMQVWSKAQQVAIIQRAAAYLQMQPFQKRARLDKALPTALEVVGVSRAITVFFIYDGTETMRGTGFDKDINDLQKQFGRDMRAADIPFVTVLQGRDGKVKDYSVSTAATVTVPRTADLFPVVLPTNAPEVVAVPPPKPPEPRHVKIVMSGSHAVTNDAVETGANPARLDAKPVPAPPVAPLPAPTNPVPGASAEPGGASKPVAATADALPSAPEPTVSKPPETKVESIPPPTDTRVADAPVPVIEVKHQPAEAPAAAPAPVARDRAPDAPKETMPAAMARTGGNPVAPTAPAPVPSVAALTPAPAPPPVVATAAAKPKPITSQATVTLPVRPGSTLLLVIASCLVLIALALLLYLLRRAKGRSGSLISQSLDRAR